MGSQAVKVLQGTRSMNLNSLFMSTYEKSYQNTFHGRKPRSNFRRPSSLGLSATPVASKTESKSNYQAKPATRTHIVAPLKDHLKPEGAFEKTSESKGNYRDLSPARPVIHKLQDHLKSEGGPI